MPTTEEMVALIHAEALETKRARDRGFYPEKLHDALLALDGRFADHEQKDDDRLKEIRDDVGSVGRAIGGIEASLRSEIVRINRVIDSLQKEHLLEQSQSNAEFAEQTLKNLEAKLADVRLEHAQKLADVQKAAEEKIVAEREKTDQARREKDSLRVAEKQRTSRWINFGIAVALIAVTTFANQCAMKTAKGAQPAANTPALAR